MLTISINRDGVWVGSQLWDLEGRTIWIVDAHGCGERFIVRGEEKLTSLVELERAIHKVAVDLIS